MGDNNTRDSLIDPFDMRNRRADARKREASKFINGGVDSRFDITNPDGSLKSQFRVQDENFFGEDRLRGLASSTGPTSIAQRLLSQQQGQSTQDRSRLDALTQSSLQNSLTGLAARGGLRSGTRERLARSAIAQRLKGRQQLAAGNADQRLKILTDDENRRLSLLQNRNQADRGDRLADLGSRVKEAELGRQVEAARLVANSQLANVKGGFGK